MVNLRLSQYIIPTSIRLHHVKHIDYHHNMSTSESVTQRNDRASLACPLLTLPGELRNCIYDQCIEPSWIKLHPADRQGKHEPPQPDFGSLRYTCRTLHSEFTPIYLARTVILLQPSNVERYLAAFYPRRTTSSNEKDSSNILPPNVHGRLLINVRLGEVLDLTPLAGLLSRAPQMHIAVARGASLDPMMKDGVELLHAITDATCFIDF